MARKTGRIQSQGRVLIATAATVAIASIASATFLANSPVDATAASPTAPATATATATIVTSEAAVATLSPAQTDEPSCPAGETYIAPEHVGVSGMPTCLPIGSELSESHVEPLYAEVALEILRLSSPLAENLEIRKPKVVCWSLNDWKKILELFRSQGVSFGTDLAGWVPLTNRVINLSYLTCKRLDAIAYAGKTPDSRLFASPVWTLAHETIHLGGIPIEGVADCFARQLTSFTAGLLGADSDTSRTIAELSLVQAEHARGGTEYDDPSCRQGGALDLGTDDAVWS